MPRRRLEVDREDKIDEILQVAKRQLLAGGFAGLSMAGVARELGVAQNAVYWYFPSRDHLFVAVLRSHLSDLAAKKPPMSPDVVERAVWIVDRIADFHPLVAAMHERSRSSEVVAEFDRELQALLRGMLLRALTPHVPAEDIDVAADAFTATIEGALLRRVSRARRAALVRYTLERFRGNPQPERKRVRHAPTKRRPG